MKSLGLAFLIISLLAASGHAECAYFRVSTKLLKCVTVDAQSIQESTSSYAGAQDLPDLAEPAHAMVRATCDCAYSLKGSDMRCDLDQTVEKSSLLDADNPSAFCRRGNSLCRDVCPSNLP
jgi:hypothetical protein